MQRGTIPDLAAVRPTEMLGDLRPRSRFTVRTVGTEATPQGMVEEFHISAQQVDGEEVFVSLRLLVSDRTDKRVVVSLPGGAGAFPDTMLPWLARTFGGNHAAIDWVGRGRSPPHRTVACRYDPIWLEGDDFRDAYLFCNLTAIWAALDWLAERGLVSDAVIGGSWGGVLCFLLSALDPRIARIYPSFGCGGFAIPGIEKRSMWEAAFVEMGPHRVREWCRAFDPLLRATDVAASVYFETATNDKFFSVDMAMATWRALPNRHFFALCHNQDHTMRPFGAQPYAVEAIDRAGDPGPLAVALAMEDKKFSFLQERGEEICWPIDDAEYAAMQLVISEQLVGHGDMSRAWRSTGPTARVNQTAAFLTDETAEPNATTLFYLTRHFTFSGRTLHAATSIHRRESRGVRDAAASDVTLLDAGADLWDAPIGDRMDPRVAADDGTYRVAFTGERRQRVTRFGIRCWLLPTNWSSIEVVCAPDCCDPAPLMLFIAARYGRFDEDAVAQAFADAGQSPVEGGGTRYRFSRDGFLPAVIKEERFGPLPTPNATAVLRAFDAIGIVDPQGRCTGTLMLCSMAVR